MPHRKLRQMYVAMVEARLLDDHLAVKKGRNKMRRGLDSIHGEEACRVSTSIDLASGDLISDSHPGPVMDLLGSASLKALLRRLDKKPAKFEDGQSSRVLPWIDDAKERLGLALGVALSFKVQQRAHTVAAYVRRGEIGKGSWRSMLTLAATLELPIFFVVLPNEAGRKEDGKIQLPQLARSCNVPGITVDAHDAVALYRVTQETLGRIRGGGGPVLIECIAYRLKGASVLPETDPLLEIKQFLLEKKVASKAWLETAGDPLRRQLAARRSQPFRTGRRGKNSKPDDGRLH